MNFPKKLVPVGSSEPIYKHDETIAAPIYNGSKAVETAELEPVDEVQEQAVKPQLKAVPVAGTWQIQAGVFGQKANADKAIDRLGNFAPVSSTQSGKLTTIYVGPFKSEAEARAILSKVKSAGYSDAWVKQVK